MSDPIRHLQGADCMDGHILEAGGKARVVIRDGAVVEIKEPVIRSCPLAARFASCADPLFSCASGAVCCIAGSRALLQAGVCIPVSSMRDAGRDLVLERIRRRSGKDRHPRRSPPLSRAARPGTAAVSRHG